MATLDPNYTSFYSPRALKWLHQAQEPMQADDTGLYPISEIETIAPPSRTARQQIPPRGRVRSWWSRCLAQDAPEFGAALGFIDDFLEESHVVSTHTELMDPTIGRLLALGNALDIENKSTRMLSIGAFASGPTGADLSVGALTERVMGLSGAKGIGVAVPRFYEGAEVVWRGGSTIRQIVFAGGVGRSARPNLAVRTVSGTTVFKQTRLQSPLVGQSNRFAPVYLVEVPARGSAHAHIEFNPWYERQFAVIDESGKWRIWDIEGRQSRDSRVRKELALVEYTSGHVPPADDSDDNIAAGKGWGRIVWGGDLHTVLACDRRRAGLFDIRIPQTGRPASPIPTNCGWIRDLNHSSFFESSGYDAFVLTSAELAWVDMRQSRKPLMSVPHRRHPDDHSLSMELFDTKSTVTTAFLHSRFNSLVTTHCFTSAEIPALLGPASRFHSPVPPDATVPVSFGLGILPCRAVARGDPDEATVERYLKNENLRFFTGFGIGKDLDVTQRVYASQNLCGHDPEFTLLVKPDSLRRSAPYVVEGSDDDADEGMELEMRGLSFEGTEQAEEAGIEFGNPCIGERVAGPIRLTTNFHKLYRHAFTDDVESLKTSTEEDAENTIEHSAAHLKALLLKRADKHDLGIISLLNLQQPARLYDHLERFETRIRALLAEDSLGEYQITSLIAFSSDNSEFLVPPADAVDSAARIPATISILPLYNKLLETWVTPLPEHTPGNARLRRERLCRMLATETWLSSIGLHLEPSTQDLPPVPDSQIDQTLLPSEPLLRIRTYANVGTRIALPEGLQGVLDRWEVGEDPWDYEYVPDEQSGGARKKMKKRGNSNRRKRGNEAGTARRSDVESWQNQIASQPPAIVVSSQPPPRGPGVGVSQTEGAAMSQVERGRNGGRPGLAARKKRKTGF